MWEHIYDNGSIQIQAKKYVELCCLVKYHLDHNPTNIYLPIYPIPYALPKFTNCVTVVNSQFPIIV